ncbi:hypothetical protein JD969_02865 [Planctomycetota bacterium]|nr:hypothetical protein JD969_02865 [Planctomycetota bacterium]
MAQIFTGSLCACCVNEKMKSPWWLRTLLFSTMFQLIQLVYVTVVMSYRFEANLAKMFELTWPWYMIVITVYVVSFAIPSLIFDFNKTQTNAAIEESKQYHDQHL